MLFVDIEVPPCSPQFQGILVIPQDDYDALNFERIVSDNNDPIQFSVFSDNSFHRLVF